MPGRLRTLSGPDVVRILGRFGFETVGQRGSHVKVRRQGEKGARVTITIPNHREIRTGTLLSIYRDACRAVPPSRSLQALAAAFPSPPIRLSSHADTSMARLRKVGTRKRVKRVETTSPPITTLPSPL